MFLHLGGDTVIPQRDIIAVIDAGAAKWPATEEFIGMARDEGFVKNIAPDKKVKSYVITSNEIYLSPISCVTLKKRTSTLSSLADNTEK